MKVFKNIEELSSAAADLFVQTAQNAIKSNNRFTVALTGGSSPTILYKLLTTPPYVEQIPWEKVYIFWGDERWVPLDDDKSNAKMAFNTLLNLVPIPKENIFPMWDAQSTPVKYAQEYEEILRKQLGSTPRFDLILLGMGEDGHTASLFPGTAVLKEEQKWVSAYYLAPQQMYRITLTAPIINQAKRIIFITYGANKAPALQEVLAGEKNPSKYPAQLIHPANGEVFWLVDEAAAGNAAKNHV